MGVPYIEIGKQYARLTVLNFSVPGYTGRSMLTCRCACGNTVRVTSNALRTGNTKSCGCLKSESSRNNVKTFWQRLPGVAATHALYSSYKFDAVKRSLTFELSEAEFKHIIHRSCYFCGQKPVTKTQYKTNGNIVYNGIDRLNPAQGYTVNNVAACCTLCNRMKGRRTEKEFTDWCHAISTTANVPSTLNGSDETDS